MTEKKKNNNSKVFVILTISSLIVLSVTYILLNKATVKGLVVDGTDGTTLINGVDITLDNTTTIKNNDITAGFTFKGIKTGEHQLRFSRIGYQEYVENVNLKMRDSLSLKIQLQKIKENKNLQKDNTKIVSISFNDNTLSITNTSAEIGNNIIEVGERPLNVDYSKSKQKIYTQSVSDGIISVIDANTGTKLKDITFANKHQIKRIKASPSGDKLYAYIIEERKIYIIDTNTDSITSSFDVDSVTMDFNMDQEMGNLYVLSTENIVTFSSSGSQISSYKLKNADFYSSIVVQNNKAFLGHSTNNFILMVDLISNTETKIPTKETIKGLLADRQNIYVLFDSSINIISSNNVDNIKNIPTGTTENNIISFSKDKNKIYISNKSETLNILDLVTQSLMDKKIKVKSNLRDFMEL